MKPEAASFIVKATDLLDRAPALLARSFPDETGRAAYLAGFHAAQALIFECEVAEDAWRCAVEVCAASR